MLTNKTKTASKPSSGLRNWVRGFVTVSLALMLTTPVFSGSAGQNRKVNQEPSRRDDEAVQLHSDLVVVNLIVTDAKGQYAHGLTAKDFKVLENDAAQPIDSFIA